MVPTTTQKITAIRTHKGSKSVIVVTLPDGSVLTAGGARADRAEAVIVTRWPHQDKARIYGVRGNASAAFSEAHRLGTAHVMRHGGLNIERTAADLSVAVLVEDEAR